ncbi:MAG: SAM-dependent chlorinase/fluorinase [Ruoffia tabacinasalis]|uniref:SAM-dependent chlorinase/fluorinase n=1 Tax=unclassified Ruoffia TaxID=2862149 RepID=UPI000ED9DF49|nr:hypothetical protein [Aerococcaceae bacterium]
MQSVTYIVAPVVTISHLTLGNELYHINNASYCLLQRATYWPAKTVFVSVVDPAAVVKTIKLINCVGQEHHYITIIVEYRCLQMFITF